MRVSTFASFTLLVLFATNPSPTPSTLWGRESGARRGGSSRCLLWRGADESDPSRTARASLGRRRLGATERVLAVLDSPLSSAGLEFVEAPLGEVVEFLPERVLDPIRLDYEGLDDLGLDSGEPVTVSMRDVKLRVALSAMLEPYEFTYVAAHGHLLITSEEQALTRLQIALYDVSDLVRDGGHATYDSLIRTITSTIACDTWAGAGTAEVLPFPERGVLVISQTSEAHEQIKGLLDALSARSPQELVSTPPSRGRSRGMPMGMMGGGFGGEGGGGMGMRGGGRGRGGTARE